ncbi:cupin domain-containing protein [Stenomitos frigidus]|nr:cupin domain-containing protein [Stenomitos frigidus]
MRSTSSQLATIFKPDEGQTLKFLGNIITYKFDPNDRGWRFFEFLMTGDSPVPLHRHPWDEVSYLLEGEVELQIEDQLVQATPGYFINLPAGAAHAFTLRSSQAKFLVGVSNAIAAQFMQELAQAEQELRLTPETTIAIAHKHQVCVVGANFQ